MSSITVPLDSVGPRVGDAMLRSPRTLGPSTTVGEAREHFSRPLVLLLLVTDGDTYLGAVDRSDLVGRPDHETLGSIASRRFPEVRPDDLIDRALELLESASGDRLPVLRDDGTLAGLICLNRDEHRFCVDADRAP